MKTMNLPGFTAEMSLYRISFNCRTQSVHGSLPAPGAVVPQLRVSAAPGCGECTPSAVAGRHSHWRLRASLLRCLGKLPD